MAHMTLGAEVALPLHLESAVSYSDVETALINAGFTEYTIVRAVNVDGTCDVQIFVRNPYDQNGQQTPLLAQETLQGLTDALAALEEEEEPTP